MGTYNPKSGLSYFQEAGVVEPVPQPDTSTTVNPLVKPTQAGAPKSKYVSPSYSSSAPLDASVLENMQKLLQQKQLQQESWAERLRDAKAWFTGMGAVQAEALKNRAAEREQQSADIFKMQYDIAQYKAQQQAAQKAYESLSGIAGGQPATVVSGAGQVSSVDVPDNVRSEMTRRLKLNDVAGAQKIYDDWFKTEVVETVKMETSANSYKKDVEMEDANGRTFFVDALTARQMRNAGTAKPTGKVISEPLAGGLTTKDVANVESKGDAAAVSPKGARGIMQVMPNTQRDPGFGVTPAKNDSAEELQRVGEEYFGAMQKRYNNDTLAAIAYNMGPGKTDEWLKAGGDFNKLPQETKDYLGKLYVSNALSTRKTAQPVSTTAPLGSVSSEARARAEADKELITSEAKKTGENLAEEEKNVRKNWLDADTKINDVDTAQTLVNQYPTMFGRLVKPGVVSMVGTGLKEGIKIGSHGQLALPSIEEMSAQMAKGADEKSLSARRQVAQILHRVELDLSSLLKGQGSVSDAERRILNGIAGSVSDPSDLLNRKLNLLRLHSEYDKAMGEEYRKSNMPWSRFIKTDAYANVIKNHTAKLQQNFKNEYNNGRDVPVTGGYSTSSTKSQWRVKRD